MENFIRGNINQGDDCFDVQSIEQNIEEMETSQQSAVKDSNDYKCYIHIVSPVKVSASGKCKYFNMTLQTSEGSRAAVCFSPEKRTTLEKHQADKSPVKISKFRLSSNHGKENVVIDQASKVTPNGDDVGFQHMEMTPPSVTSLSSLNQVSSEQLVTVKAKFAKISGSKKITTSRNSQMTKQELVIVDPTASAVLPQLKSRFPSHALKFPEIS